MMKGADMSKRHISTSIDGLLALSDKELTRLLDSVQDEKGNHPTLSEFKKYLNEEKAKGHRLLPSPECDNFDPVHGCLGHPPVEYVQS
jgi:hypothetical protein